MASRPMRKLGVSFGAKLELDIVVGEQPPAATEAVVVPQDVNLIMGDVEPIEDTSETTQDVLARGVEARPRRAGTLVVGGAPQGAPLLMQAIVYDFEHSPPACEDHVFEALVRALEEAKTRGLSRIAVRPLGTAHAGIEPAEFLRLLAQACYSCAELGTTLRKVHLLLPSPEELARYEGLLQQVVQARKG